MPYHLIRREDRYCVALQDSNELVPGGCHETEQAALDHLAALEANVTKSLTASRTHVYKAEGEASELRLMLIITSNAYRDREGEIISQKALRQYVEESWQGSEFIGQNPLLVWHRGDPIGDIVYADMEGPFLIEVARERPNTIVNLAEAGQAPLYAEIKTVWNGLEAETEVGASHQFYYWKEDRADKVYERIGKRETSVLPRAYAANVFTEAEIIGEEPHE